jgi:hypothetical protein
MATAPDIGSIEAQNEELSRLGQGVIVATGTLGARRFPQQINEAIMTN